MTARLILLFGLAALSARGQSVSLAPRQLDLPAEGVTVPLHLLMGSRATVDVIVNGRGPYVFAIETGAPVIVLTDKLAADLHLATSAAPSSGHELIRLDSLRVGDLVLRDVPAATGPEYLPGVDGLLGLTAYADLVLTIDYPARRVAFARRALPAPNGRDVLPTVALGPFIGVTFDVGNRHQPAVLDTQSSSAIDCAPDVADSLRFVSAPVVTGRVAIGGQPPVSMASARLDGDIRLGAFTIQRPIINIVSPPPGFPRKCLLGSQFLMQFAVSLDQRNGRVRLSRSDPVVPPPHGVRVIGVALAPGATGGVVIADARAGGPAAAAGLRAGDDVIRIAERPAAEFLAPEALPALVQRGRVIHFSVRRDGRPLEFDVSPADLVP